MEDKVIEFSDVIKLTQDWLRKNVVFNLYYASFIMEYASSPNKDRDHFLVVCSIIPDINVKREHYGFLINKDGTFRKIGKGQYDEKEKKIVLEELNLEWKETKPFPKINPKTIKFKAFCNKCKSDDCTIIQEIVKYE